MEKPASQSPESRIKNPRRKQTSTDVADRIWMTQAMRGWVAGALANLCQEVSRFLGFKVSRHDR